MFQLAGCPDKLPADRVGRVQVTQAELDLSESAFLMDAQLSQILSLAQRDKGPAYISLLSQIIGSGNSSTI